MHDGFSFIPRLSLALTFLYVRSAVPSFYVFVCLSSVFNYRNIFFHMFIFYHFLPPIFIIINRQQTIINHIIIFYNDNGWTVMIAMKNYYNNYIMKIIFNAVFSYKYNYYHIPSRLQGKKSTQTFSQNRVIVKLNLLPYPIIEKMC